MFHHRRCFTLYENYNIALVTSTSSDFLLLTCCAMIEFTLNVGCTISCIAGRKHFSNSCLHVISPILTSVGHFKFIWNLNMWKGRVLSNSRKQLHPTRHSAQEHFYDAATGGLACFLVVSSKWLNYNCNDDVIYPSHVSPITKSTWPWSLKQILVF